MRTLVLLLLLPVVVFGQTNFGLKAGLNVSDIVMTNYVNPDVEADLGLKLGVHGGVFVNGNFDDRLGLAAELLYSDKGVKGITNIHLHYIMLPMLIRYKLNDHFSGVLGPEPAYLFAAKSAHGDVSSTYNNRFDLSLNAGIEFSTGRILLGIRYAAGLFSVRDGFEIQGSSGMEKVKYQNRVVQFSLGYKVFVYE